MGKDMKMARKEPTSRKLQAIQTKEQLLNTAMNMISEKGYDDVKITDICQAVGVSVGAFYHYFKGKEDIIIEAYRRYDAKYKEYVESKLIGLSPMEQIVWSIKYQVKYSQDTGVDTMRQFYRSQLLAGREFFISSQRTFPVMLTEIVRKAQEDGSLSNRLEPEQIVRELLRFSRGIIYDWCAYNGSYDIVEETERTLNLILSGMQADAQ